MHIRSPRAIDLRWHDDVTLELAPGSGASTFPASGQPRRGALIATLATCAAAFGVAALWTSSASAADLFPPNDPCGLSIVAPGKAAGVPNAIEALPGDVVHLGQDGFCTPQVGPVTNKAGVTSIGLVAGNGPTLDAPGVTLDLAGHSISSTFDVFAFCQTLSPPADCENSGVSLNNKNTTVTNLSPTPSVVSDFTTDFNVARAESARIVGAVVDPATGAAAPGAGGPSVPAAAYNLVGRNSHFGGALSLDKSKGVTVDTVWLTSQTATGGDGLGADLKRSDAITLQNSRVEADLSGVRWKQGNSFYALRNSLVDATGGAGSGTAVTARTINDSGSSGGVFYGLFGNTLRAGSAGGDGIDLLARSLSVPIVGNTIDGAVGGCGLKVSLDSSASTIVNNTNTVTKDFTATSPLLAANTFTNNLDNLCRR